MKSLFLMLCFASGLFADIPNQMIRLYQKGVYIESCKLGGENYKKIQSNEDHVSLYAFSCLNADQIDRLNISIKTLNQGVEARTNASYFSLLVLQKKLLSQSLYDNYPLKSLKLPTSSHLLSKIFDLYCKNPQAGNAIKEYIDPLNPKQTYKLYTMQIDSYKTFAIDEYYDKILTKHHIYE